MAGETINQPSAAWYTIQAAASTLDAAVSAGARTAINATALSVNERKYPLLDFRLDMSVGTPVVNQTVDLYRRPKMDGTNEAPAVTATYLHKFVDSFVLNALAGPQYYYIDSIPNPDPNATYYLVNQSGATLTIALAVASRGWNTAV